MTDNEIMSFDKAMFILRHGSAEGVHKYLEAIKVIENEVNRQKAEIESQREYLNVSKIRAEAIKDFAERLKERKYLSSGWSHGEHPYVVEESDIDDVLDEMVGD